MPVPLIPIVIVGANIVARVAPRVAKSLMSKGLARKASKKVIEKQTTASRQPIKTMSEARATKLAKDAAPKIGGKVPGKRLPRNFGKVVSVVGGGAALATATGSGKSKKVPKIEVGPAPKVTALKPKGPKVNQAKKDSKQEAAPKKTGSEYKAYPGAAGRAGFEYRRDTAEILDDKTVSDEIKEKIEEEELYEGDSKGGRVGKGKKKKVSQAPRGVRSAIRGFKPNMGASKRSKRTRGTGGGWV